MRREVSFHHSRDCFSVNFGPTKLPNEPKESPEQEEEEGGQNKTAVTVDRTRDLFITSEMHYHCAITAIVVEARFFVT